MTDHDDLEELEELLAAYAIDALDDDERDEVDIYLDANPAQRAEVRRLTTAFEELVVAHVQPATPPPDLWDRISVRLADEGKVASVRVPSIVTELADIDAPAAEPVDLASRRSRSSRSALAAVVLAAAAVALVALGLSLRPKEADTTMLAARAAQAESEPGSLSGSLTTAEGNLDMRVVLDDDGQMYVVPHRMPPLEDDQAYQLWALDSGTPVSLGVLRGPASMALPSGEHPTKLAISKEPVSGSPQPTTAPLASAQLA